MAKHKGKEGIIKVGSTVVAQIRSITVNESVETIETTELNSDAKTFEPGTVSWDASADAFYHEADAGGQDALAIGSQVDIGYYPIGDALGNQYASGTVIVTGRNMSNAQDGMVEVSLTFQGSGALNWAAV